MEDDLRDIWDLANKNNVAIYAVDPRGLATNEFGIDQNIGTRTDSTYLRSTMDTLRTLAFQTDGRAIVNRNDITMGMKQIVRDNSAYYLLGYNSTFTATDGKFHEIKVKVNRPGIQVRARKGYWAFTADDAARALAPPKAEAPKAVDTAIAAITTPSRARVVRTWIGTERGADGKTKVTFLWEPVPRPRAMPRAAGHSRPRIDHGRRAGRVAVLSRKNPETQQRDSGDDRLQDFLRRTTRQDAVARVGRERRRGGSRFGSSRDCRPGPDRAADACLARRRSIEGRTVPEYQRLKTDPQAMPTAAREFSRTERVFIRVPAYAPGTSAPTVTAKLLNRSGQAMSDLTVAPPLAPAMQGHRSVARVDAARRVCRRDYRDRRRRTGEGTRRVPRHELTPCGCLRRAGLIVGAPTPLRADAQPATVDARCRR